VHLELKISLPIDTVFLIQVAQIRIRRKLSLHVINLAVGAELELPINYFDSLGVQISLNVSACLSFFWNLSDHSLLLPQETLSLKLMV